MGNRTPVTDDLMVIRNSDGCSSDVEKLKIIGISDVGFRIVDDIGMLMAFGNFNKRRSRMFNTEGNQES